MKENRLRRLLNEGKPSIGTRVESVWPIITEIAGSAGCFDYIEFVAEYAPFSHADLENIARAAELTDMGTMIKVDYQNREYAAQKAMASGFQAVLLTDHKSAAEVRDTIRALRPDTPRDGGRFGYPNRRWIGFEPHMPQMEHARRARETVIAVMIEKWEALEDIDAICAVDGVDLLQFGPSDYSMSVGWNASEHAEEVKAAERVMIEAALRNGKQARCEINAPAEAAYYIGLGVRHFCIGDELRILTNHWRQQGSALRDIVVEL